MYSWGYINCVWFLSRQGYSIKKCTGGGPEHVKKYVLPLGKTQSKYALYPRQIELKYALSKGKYNRNTSYPLAGTK